MSAEVKPTANQRYKAPHPFRKDNNRGKAILSPRRKVTQGELLAVISFCPTRIG
jgi:hypothetical protein